MSFSTFDYYFVNRIVRNTINDTKLHKVTRTQWTESIQKKTDQDGPFFKRLQTGGSLFMPLPGRFRYYFVVVRRR